MRWLSVVVILGFAIGWFSGEGSGYSTVETALDLSWPNCGIARPIDQPYGIVGVNGGLAFRPNPCLAKQAGWFKNLSVYVNTGYPGIKYGRRYSDWPRKCATNDNKCLAYNYGYNAGRYDINYALNKGVVADRWWLDVETENSWTNQPEINRLALTGTLDAISGFTGRQKIGFYSYPAQWNRITGNWKNDFPAWVATGSTKLADAVRACQAPSFTGGKALLAQYLAGVDKNYICKDRP